MLHTVIQVTPTPDFKVYVYFSDGRIKLFDMSPLLTKGVFKPISDSTLFIEKCTVMNGTLAWNLGITFDQTSCIDVDPETIYTTGIDVADPLSGEEVA